MTITGGSALPKDDIERMMRDAQDHADEDKRRREEAETRNLAEALQWQTEKFLAESGDKLPAENRDADQRGARRPARRARRHRHREDQVGAREARPGLAAGRLAALRAAGRAGRAAGRRRPVRAAGCRAGAGAAGAPRGGDDVVDAEIVDEDDKK